ncbi:hypothetical protein WMW72_26530 [Paenibacillus filicis]|uniref:Uncharacterized protein n=1 Tax=Paenibacillus filicis TaxID=669464 RepID=A0ABU9DRI0_9BACL
MLAQGQASNFEWHELDGVKLEIIAVHTPYGICAVGYHEASARAYVLSSVLHIEAPDFYEELSLALSRTAAKQTEIRTLPVQRLQAVRSMTPGLTGFHQRHAPWPKRRTSPPSVPLTMS